MVNQNKKISKVAFGGGCFWCSEIVFKILKGVINVTPGYAGGKTENPNYEQVSTGTTGHAEVVLIEYDSEIISFRKLLEVFFMAHDPTSLNRQGNDVGTQYRSILLYENETQKKEASNYIKKLIAEKKYEKPIVTEIVPLKKFYPAEQYHEDYYKKHSDEPYSAAVIKPKLEKITEKFKDILK